jgi:hypothetical protein
MPYRIIFGLLLLLLPLATAGGQDKITLDGYVSDMQTVYHLPDQWLWENSLHNRLNLTLYPSSWLTGTLQLRNRAIVGNTLRKIPGYTEGLDGVTIHVRKPGDESGETTDQLGTNTGVESQ